MEEVCSSIWRLKNGKAPGVCGVTGEILKAGGRTVVHAVATQNHRLDMEEWECSSGLAESTDHDCPDSLERKQNQMRELSRH